MNLLSISNPIVPFALQSMFSQWVRPWRMDDSLIDAMFRPRLPLMDTDFNRSFDLMMRQFANTASMRDGLLGSMDVSVDVVEKNGSYKVSADLPGMKKEDITVRIDRNIVNIEANTQHSSEQKEANSKVVFNERYYGTLSRSFSLDREIDESKATGKYTDGVLTLDLPKKQYAPKTEAMPIAID